MTNPTLDATIVNISLADMAAVATGTATRSGAAPFYTLTVEEARVFCNIKNGNKKEQADGSQALTVVLGKHTLPMDAIKAGTTRLAVTAEQVEPFTAALQDAINQGLFDEGIVKAQELSKAQAEKVAANPVKRAPKAVAAEDTAGLDLEALDNLGEEGETPEAPEVDTNLEA